MTCGNVLDRIEFNIDMFAEYRPTQYNRVVLAKLMSEKAQVLKMMSGHIEFKDMTYGAKEWFGTMPSWGTYGT